MIINRIKARLTKNSVKPVLTISEVARKVSEIKGIFVFPDMYNVRRYEEDAERWGDRHKREFETQWANGLSKKINECGDVSDIANFIVDNNLFVFVSDMLFLYCLFSNVYQCAEKIYWERTLTISEKYSKNEIQAATTLREAASEKLKELEPIRFYLEHLGFVFYADEDFVWNWQKIEPQKALTEAVTKAIEEQLALAMANDPTPEQTIEPNLLVANESSNTHSDGQIDNTVYSALADLYDFLIDENVISSTIADQLTFINNIIDGNVSAYFNKPQKIKKNKFKSVLDSLRKHYFGEEWFGKVCESARIERKKLQQHNVGYDTAKSQWEKNLKKYIEQPLAG